MPGTNLNLDLPSLSDSLATIVSKITTALSAIQTDLTPKITASELNVNAGVSFSGNALTGLGSATLVGGNVPTAAGSLYYNGGEFYVIDATGVVKLTNQGSIAIAGVKGIGGDYGNIANSAVLYYDNTSSEYRFFDGTGTGYANVVGGALNLKNGSTATTKLVTTAASSFTLTLPSVLPGTTSLVYLTSGGVFQTTKPTLTLSIPAGSASLFQNATIGAGGKSVGSAGGATIIYYPITLPVGATITGYTLWMKKASGSGVTTQSSFSSIAGNTGSITNITAGTGTEANSAAAPNFITLTKTGLSTTIVTGTQYVIVASNNGAAATDEWYHVEVTYTPAI